MLSEPRRGAAHVKRSHVNCLMKYKEADGDIWEAQSKGAKVRSSQQQGRGGFLQRGSQRGSERYIRW